MQPPRTVPAAPAPPARASSPGGRALGSMAAAIGRGLGRVEARLLVVLDQAYGGTARDMARLEAALLLRLRRGLCPYLRDPSGQGAASERIDVVLADGLLEAVDAAVATVVDLEGELAARLGRMLEFCQELLAELVALGEADVAAERRAAADVKARLASLADGSEQAAAVRQLSALYVGLARRLEQHSPLRAPTLLDEVLRGVVDAASPAAR